MSTPSQIAANRANAKHSSGPTTETGKAASSINNFRHGLAGAFMVLQWEEQEEFDHLFEALRAEHQPATPTEALLVESMAQCYWLRQRAMRLQLFCFKPENAFCDMPKELALFLRYQATHERGFHKALNDLLKLRAETRKHEIGFESQKRREAEDARKEAAEKRKQDLHRLAVSLADAKLDHQKVRTSTVRRSSGTTSPSETRPMTAEKAA